MADELRFGGKLSEVHAENGRVLFEGDETILAWQISICAAPERVLIRLGAFPAKPSINCLKECVLCHGKQFIPKDGAFPVKGA